jgi:UMF1 family MFS transporter
MLKRFTKPERAWIMYDWANSAQSAIIVAILLPILYKNIAVGAGVDKSLATSYWGYASSAASFLAAIAAPIMGTLGDFMGLRKRLFSSFLIVGVIATALLTFAPNWVVILVLFAFSCIGFYISNLYYDSMLVDVTTPERMDLVSTTGYSLGYIGGSTIPLVFSLALYATSSTWPRSTTSPPTPRARRRRTSKARATRSSSPRRSTQAASTT